jgi:hypothetical protein
MHIPTYISICNYVGAYEHEKEREREEKREREREREEKRERERPSIYLATQWMYISVASTLLNLASRLQPRQVHRRDLYKPSTYRGGGSFTVLH